MNEKAIVIGASTGIGRAVALRLADAGMAVTVTGREADKLTGFPESIESAALDGRDNAAMAAFFEAQAPFDHLILALGGGGATGPFLNIEESAFRQAFNSKFWPYIRCVQLGAQHMRAGGSVTLVTGAAARKAVLGMSGLSATNGALEAMIAPMALELAPIRVNAVSPGLIATPYWDQMGAEARDKMYDSWGQRTPLGRVGTADEVAMGIMALVTNPYVTGTVFTVDGGTVAS